MSNRMPDAGYLTPDAPPPEALNLDLNLLADSALAEEEEIKITSKSKSKNPPPHLRSSPNLRGAFR